MRGVNFSGEHSVRLSLGLLVASAALSLSTASLVELLLDDERT